jgi:molecular chaperone DnaK (HSP70)
MLTLTRTFTTVADNQQTVQFPVYQGERVNCEDNTSLGEFTLAPIPPMKAGEPVLEVVFEVDVNGILKVTATEKTSGRSANITISNSVGKLSTTEIEKMIDGKTFPRTCTSNDSQRRSSSRTRTRRSASASRPSSSSRPTSRASRT